MSNLAPHYIRRNGLEKVIIGSWSFLFCSLFKLSPLPSLELCSMAVHGAPSAKTDPRLTDILRVATLERNLVAASRDKGSVITFSKLSATAPPDAVVAINEV